MSHPPPPRRSRMPSLPLVWIVPLVALAIAGWLLLGEWRRRGPEIVITFNEGSGVEAGRTLLLHKGVTVGRVTQVELADDLQRVAVHLQLERSAAGLAREGSEFWVVQPEISLSSIRGLDTLFSGVRLAVRPGGGEPTLHFNGLDRPPAARNIQAGRAFVLEAPRLMGLSPGTSVSYRDIKVGVVEESRLSDDARKVLIRVRIDAPYVPLVRTDTRFWNSGGLSMRVGLLGAEVNAASLTSLLQGSISLATPEDEANARPAPAGARFVLHEKPEDAWLKWSPAIPLDLPRDPTEPGAAVIGAEPSEP